MKKSLNAWSVPENVGFEDMFRALKKAGFDAVELNVDAVGHSAHSLTLKTTVEELAAIRKLSEEIGLPVCSISTSLWGRAKLGSFEGEIPTAELLTKQLQCAEALGADGILIVPGGISDAHSIREAWEHAKAELLACREIIESGKILVGVENVWNGFFMTPYEMARFVDELSIRNLGAYFDVGNVEIFSYPEYWIDILDKRIVKIHVKDYRKTGNNAGAWVNLLEGSIRWEKVVPALRKAGYDGYITAELPAMPKTPDYLYDTTVSALERIIAY